VPPSDHAAVIVHLTRWDLVRLNLERWPRATSTWVTVTLFALAAGVPVVSAQTWPLSAFEWCVSLMAASVIGFLAGLFFLSLGLLVVLLASKASNGILGEHHYVLEAAGLRERTSANENLTKWGGALRVSRTSRHILIQVAPALFHVLPLRCFESQRAFEDFFAASRPLARAAAHS